MHTPSAGSIPAAIGVTITPRPTGVGAVPEMRSPGGSAVAAVNFRQRDPLPEYRWSLIDARNAGGIGCADLLVNSITLIDAQDSWRLPMRWPENLHFLASSAERCARLPVGNGSQSPSSPGRYQVVPPLTGCLATAWRRAAPVRSGDLVRPNSTAIPINRRAREETPKQRLRAPGSRCGSWTQARLYDRARCWRLGGGVHQQSGLAEAPEE